MLKAIFEAINARVRITFTTPGCQGRFAFEPHIVYTDPCDRIPRVAGYLLGTVGSASYMRTWTEFEVPDMEDVGRTQIRFYPDEQSRKKVRETLGITHTRVE